MRRAGQRHGQGSSGTRQPRVVWALEQDDNTRWKPRTSESTTDPVSNEASILAHESLQRRRTNVENVSDRDGVCWVLRRPAVGTLQNVFSISL